ncbi:MAG: S-methyl-5-thioribose-1-phosphate isomerase [Syntrophaceae bacterium]|nr:S-methyl-5-thioribose-1-phosphate isomerase [Syntrophaceae bacterium]
MIRTVFWQNGTVGMIDQKALPLEERYLAIERWEDVAEAIRDLTVRGAPAIGVAAALGIALGVRNTDAATEEELRASFEGICKTFAKTRPTAVNLFWAIERMKKSFRTALADQSGVSWAERLAALREVLLREAVHIHDADIAANRAMGLHGRVLLEDGDGVLTHCNAGALATAGYGTALGVIRAAYGEGKRLTVYVDETRPVLQGARLTAWELTKEGIPAVLITDNMAAFLMKQGKVRKVITGADRIAANGDAANKIGTYGVAVLAEAHGIPFYIAAPLSTIDLTMATGDAIPIEERDSSEVTILAGRRIAPEGIAVYNPAFDVTPARLITAIVTEAGIARPPYEKSLAALGLSKADISL